MLVRREKTHRPHLQDIVTRTKRDEQEGILVVVIQRTGDQPIGGAEGERDSRSAGASTSLEAVVVAGLKNEVGDEARRSCSVDGRQ